MEAKHAEGVIRADEFYTRAAFQRLMRLSDRAFRALRQKGLPVIGMGRRSFCSGRQVIQFFEGLSNDGNTSESR